MISHYSINSDIVEYHYKNFSYFRYDGFYNSKQIKGRKSHWLEIPFKSRSVVKMLDGISDLSVFCPSLCYFNQISSLNTRMEPKIATLILIWYSMWIGGGNLSIFDTPLNLEPVHLLICIWIIYYNPVILLICLILSKWKHLFRMFQYSFIMIRTIGRR